MRIIINSILKKSSGRLTAFLFLLVLIFIFSCSKGKNSDSAAYKIISDCLTRPDLIRFVPLAFYCDFENNPLSDFNLEGFSNPQIRNDRITLAWGMGIRSDIKFPASSKNINHITFRAKSHPSRGSKPWPFQVWLNDVLVLQGRMKPGWEQFSFTVAPEQLSPDNNRLTFIYSANSIVPTNVSEQEKRRPVAAFDFVYMSETSFDYKLSYSHKKNCIFKVNKKNQQAFLEPMGSTYWFEQRFPKKSKLQFGLIIDAKKDSKPFELVCLYKKKGHMQIRSLKLDDIYALGNGIYEGFWQLPFSIPGNREFGLRISGPGNQEYLGKAGFYLLNIVSQE